MASNGPCLTVTWIIFKNHLLEVGLKQNQETWHSKHSQLVGLSIESCARNYMNANSLK